MTASWSTAPDGRTIPSQRVQTPKQANAQVISRNTTSARHSGCSRSTELTLHAGQSANRGAAVAEASYAAVE